MRDEADEIPNVAPVAVDAITDMLIEDQGMMRPPTKAAALLAIICALHKQGKPFPRRECVADAIDAAVSTVDAALSSRLDEGYLTMRTKVKRGNVQRRNSVVRERYYEPSAKLLRTYEEAAAKARRRHN